MEKKKVLRTLMGMVLAIAITFAAIPQTASAAAYSLGKINTGAQPGGTYTIKTYFPGIGFQSIKVSYDNISKQSGYLKVGYNQYVPAIQANVTMRVSIPNSTQKKIKQNCGKIVLAGRYTKNRQIPEAFLVDATTGCCFTNSNCSGKVYAAKADARSISSKVFRQRYGHYNCTYTCETSYAFDYTIFYPPTNEGNLLIGVAGTNKDISQTSSKVSNFKNGYAPITSSAFYKNKKKLSIFARI